MKDQVSNQNSRGIRASHVGDDRLEEHLEDILNLKEKILNNYRHIFRQLKRNHLKSLLETAFAQSKQIWSVDDGDAHTRSIDAHTRSIAGFQCHAIQNRSKSKSKPFNR